MDWKLITAVEMLRKASLSETLIKFQESIDLSRSQKQKQKQHQEQPDLPIVPVSVILSSLSANVFKTVSEINRYCSCMETAHCLPHNLAQPRSEDKTV